MKIKVGIVPILYSMGYQCLIYPEWTVLHV